MDRSDNSNDQRSELELNRLISSAAQMQDYGFTRLVQNDLEAYRSSSVRKQRIVLGIVLVLFAFAISTVDVTLSWLGEWLILGWSYVGGLASELMAHSDSSLFSVAAIPAIVLLWVILLVATDS